jgi:hypothetical protein
MWELVQTWGKRHLQTRSDTVLGRIEDDIRPQYCRSGRNKISKIRDKTKARDHGSVKGAKDREQRITNRRQSMTALGISRDLTVYTCISKADRDPHLGRSSPIFGRHSPLCKVIHESDLHPDGPEPKAWQLSCVVKQSEEPGRNCEKYCGKERGWLSSSIQVRSRRMP